MQQSERLQIEYVPIADLIAANYNPRSITPAAMAKLRTGIRELGFVDPVIANRTTGNIVGGHQRVDAAKGLGMTEVPVVWITVDEETEKALNVSLNNPELSGTFDHGKLAELVQSLDHNRFVQELTGFDSRQIAKMIDELTPAPDAVYPLAPRFLESYNYVVVITDNETDWLRLQDLLALGDEQSYKSAKIGVGRVLTFPRFMDAIEDLRQ